jgi:hypothetical protein
MRLYVRTFGLTESRLYGTAVIVWIGATIGVFARGILAGRPQGMVNGAIASAVLVLGVLNVVNPSALIARVNLGRTSVRALDGAYLASLSAEAVPVLASRIATLDPPARCAAGSGVLERWRAGPQGDWRGWNVARTRARDALPTIARAVASCAPATPRARATAVSAPRAFRSPA